MVSTPICLSSTDTGMGNPIIGSVCNKVESQSSTICVPRSRSISHNSRCCANELEGTLGTHIPTTSSVTMGARSRPNGTSANWSSLPHWHQAIWFPLLLGMLVQPPLRIPNIPRLLSQPRGQIRCDPSNPQLHAWIVSGMPSAAEAFRSTFVSCVSRPQRESTLAIYESKWRIFTDWCNIQHISPLSETESVVSGFLLHLHMEKHLAISTSVRN